MRLSDKTAAMATMLDRRRSKREALVINNRFLEKRKRDIAESTKHCFRVRKG